MMTESAIQLVLGSWIMAAVILFLLWLVYLWRKDPSIVDIGWAGSIGYVTWWMFNYSSGGGLRRWVLLLSVLAWSFRLVGLLLIRMFKGQGDQRYIELSKHWNQGLAWKYFIFFQAQAVTVAILVIPVALSLLAPNASWSAWDTFGFVLFGAAFVAEVIADRQMSAFRAQPETQGKVCNSGLWYYSRHPNYFFEWLIWVSYALIAMNHPYGWLGWISPALILFSIFKVTGIPPTEERLLASKGDAYREYQRTTSIFIPLPPEE